MTNTVTIQTSTEDQKEQLLIVSYNPVKDMVALSSLMESKNNKCSHVHHLKREDIDRLINVLNELKADNISRTE